MTQTKKKGFWLWLATFATKRIGQTTKSNDGEPIQIIEQHNPMDDKYLFDFKPMFTAPDENRRIQFGNVGLGNEATEGLPKTTITPKQALKELETMPTPISLANIDDKIAVMKDKAKLIQQSYAKREVNAVLERLENRKKYPQFKDFFDNFQNTDQEKIDALLEKTGLVMKTSDIFIPEFPDDAIKIMTEYTKKVEEVTGKKPVFYVIADQKEFRKAYEKRDPILLAQSPFGFFWQILGAWDEEMLLLSEL